MVNSAEQFTPLYDPTAALVLYGEAGVLPSTGGIGLVDYYGESGNIFPATPVTFYQSGQLQNISAYFSFTLDCPASRGCADGMSFIVRSLFTD